MRLRHLILAATAVGALALSGCAASTTPADDATGEASGIALPASIEEKGAIDVGVYFNYPPYTFEKDGKLQGIEADLMRAVADKLGVEASFHDLAFEAMIPSVTNGRMDVLVGPMGDTEERREAVTFIDTLELGLQAVVKKGNPTGFDIESPCGTKGGEVAASNNYYSVEFLSKKCEADGEKPISLLSLPDAGNVFQSVLSGRTDFTLQEPALAKYMVESNPDLEIVGAAFPSPLASLQGWVVKKGNTELTEAILTAIDELIEDGTWGEIMEDAGLTEVALLPPLVDGEKPAAE